MTTPQVHKTGVPDTEAVGSFLSGKILSFDEAVRYLCQGGIIIYPTETFFAVGCALSVDGHTLQRLFASKARPLTRPLPLLAAKMEHIHDFAYVTQAEKRLMERFWPGPLTVLCKAKSCVPPLVRAGTGKVAVRISSHTVATALATAVEEPLVCSSANRSGFPPVADANVLDPKLLQYVDGILLDGEAPYGTLPSTIVEVLANGHVRVLREGAVAKKHLQ